MFSGFKLYSMTLLKVLSWQHINLLGGGKHCGKAVPTRDIDVLSLRPQKVPTNSSPNFS
jgi:hypothetical protein